MCQIKACQPSGIFRSRSPDRSLLRGMAGKPSLEVGNISKVSCWLEDFKRIFVGRDEVTQYFFFETEYPNIFLLMNGGEFVYGSGTSTWTTVLARLGWWSLVGRCENFEWDES